MASDSSTATINHSGNGWCNGYSLRPWSQVVRGGGEPDTAVPRSPSASPSSVTSEQNLLFSDQLTVTEPQTAAAVETHPAGSEGSNNGNASGIQKSAWNKPSANGVIEGTTPVMCASWPALSELTRPLPNSLSFSSDSSSKPTSDPSITVSQAPILSQTPEKRAKNNASYHTNQNHAHPVRQRPVKQRGGYNRPQPPPPPPMPLFPLFDTSYNGFGATRRNSFGPSPHFRGYMQQPHLGPAPFIAPQFMRPYGTPLMDYDMATPYLYVPTLPPVPPAPPSMFVPSLRVLIVKQIDYYFSDANLVKDNFLKSNMDDEGWVPIMLIAGFRRVQSLTSDVQMIINSLKDSSIVEVQGEKVRRRNEWRKWVKTSEFPRDSSVLETCLQKLKLDESTTIAKSVTDMNGIHNDSSKLVNGTFE